MAVKAYYSASVADFIADNDERILGVLTTQHHHALEGQQRFAWIEQFTILRAALGHRAGWLFLECYIPRMGKRADAVFVSAHAVFVLEFKVGAREHSRDAINQVEDYALDLKNFHEGSHDVPIVPVLISTNAPERALETRVFAMDGVAEPLLTNSDQLGELLENVDTELSDARVDAAAWAAAGYKPTPTIVEAAQSLYRTHSVTDIARSDAGAKNLQECGSACKRDPVSGVIGVQKGPLILMV